MTRLRRRRRVRAFTLVEATLSTVVVGLMLVAALNIGGAARLGEYKLNASSRAMILAQGLMTEIRQQAYEDPNNPVFGNESGEQTSNRTDFDDVDDYHNWSAGPPQRPDGTDLPNLNGWQRSVQVDWVELANLSQISGSDQGVKRLTVTVTHNSAPVVTLTDYSTSTWPDYLAPWSND